ncbi:lysophospholipase-like protein 1 [Ischnura elegans]|uniref:lysophospholipase-like protein 1 n=1 Tax=Ischnura elegans TaxID=197161 RepID=UPI001ED87C37|nr:lysophospholipase-like protein 1 [Ischnura elegans]XP_046398445.1 lysophospholipase-like protein 1 [Ischnura elegans]
MSVPRLMTNIQLNQQPSGSVIFLHGSGDTGNGVRLWIKEMLAKEWKFPHLRVLFPTAPVLNYKPMGGVPSNVWFDRHSISPEVPECLESIESSMGTLKQLVDKEIELGIPLNRIIIGGFSMGGAMALHLTYRMFQSVGGCFAISSFLNDSSIVYQTLETTAQKPLPPLCMMHGDCDELVPMEWGAETLKQLQRCGVDGTMTIARRVTHEITREQIINLTNWINERVPCT